MELTIETIEKKVEEEIEKGRQCRDKIVYIVLPAEEFDILAQSPYVDYNFGQLTYYSKIDGFECHITRLCKEQIFFDLPPYVPIDLSKYAYVFDLKEKGQKIPRMKWRKWE